MKTSFFLSCLLIWLNEEKMVVGEMIEDKREDKEKVVVGEIVEDKKMVVGEMAEDKNMVVGKIVEDEKMVVGEMLEDKAMVVGEMVEDEGEGSVRLATICKGRGKKMARNLQRLVSHSTGIYRLRPGCYPFT